MSRIGALWVGLLAIGVAGLAAACDEARDTGSVTSRASGETSSSAAAEVLEERDVALVRAVNAVPGGPVRIWAGDSAVFGRVDYGQATEYREIPDDMFNFEIKAAAGAEPLAQNRENLRDGGRFTIVALPGQGGADTRNLRVLDDDLKPVNPDKARLRFINGVPGAMEVDVYLRGRRDALFDGVDFEEEAGWKELVPMAGTIEVRPEDRRNVLVSLRDVRLEGGRSYTFLLSGGPGKYELIRIEDTVAPDPSP